MRNPTKFAIWMAIGALILAGCGSADEGSTATPDPSQIEDIRSIISATGVVVPERWAALSMSGPGVVAEVLVSEGDHATAGQPLVRLDGQGAAAAELRAAQYELVAAQQALDALRESAAIDASLAHQALANAHRAVIAAEREAVPFGLQAYEDDLERAREDVANAEDRLQAAQEDFGPYDDLDEDNATREAYQDRLDEAQRRYDEALRVQHDLELDEDQAAAALALARANLAYAQDDYRQHQNGPDPDDLALARSRLDQADARLRGAQEALDRLELRAPFEGVVCNLRARVGEWLAPGVPVLYLGDLEGLRVETTDLNEIDAGRIEPGQDVIVTFDALPGVTVDGVIQRIAYKAAEGSGVNYTAVVQLAEVPDRLRWGMTAFVDIEVDE